MAVMAYLFLYHLGASGMKEFVQVWVMCPPRMKGEGKLLGKIRKSGIKSLFFHVRFKSWKTRATPYPKAP